MSANPTKLNTFQRLALTTSIIEPIKSGIHSTLNQIGQIQCEFQKEFFEENWQPESKISVFINFNQDEKPHQVRIHFENNAALQILEKLTGEMAPEDSAELLDGVGEISNMIYGLIKTNLKSQGIQFSMSRPEAQWTKDLLEKVKDIPHTSLIIPFKMFNGQCYFEYLSW